MKSQFAGYFKQCIIRILSDVAIIVSNHLDKENFWLTLDLLGQKCFDDADGPLAVINQRLLYRLLVVGQGTKKVRVLRIPGDAIDCATCDSL